MKEAVEANDDDDDEGAETTAVAKTGPLRRVAQGVGAAGAAPSRCPAVRRRAFESAAVRSICRSAAGQETTIS